MGLRLLEEAVLENVEQFVISTKEKCDYEQMFGGGLAEATV